MNNTHNLRKESDSLGSMDVPADAYYGIYTMRVLHNFFPTDSFVPRLFITTYLRIKSSYAIVNLQEKKIAKKQANAIVSAVDKILAWDSETFRKNFPIGRVQSGGGTSTNMMVNEVIANVAAEITHHEKGTYTFVHPNDHVNMSQSSNDTFPGVTKITTLLQVLRLLESLENLKVAFHKKEAEFKGIEKTGRTHLQDALKMQLSEEFSAFTRTIEKNIYHLNQTSKVLYELPFGATAIGSMQNVSPSIRKRIIEELRKQFNIKFVQQANYFEGTNSSSDILKVSAAVAVLASDLIKIGSDLRILASGPRAGIAEIALPEVQAGSSIMPGKVNPSIIEALIMICFNAIGLHHANEIANMHSQLQLQVYSPVIAFNIYDTINALSEGINIFIKNCLTGIAAKPEEIAHNLERSFVYATEYSEKLGYSKVAALVKKAYKENLNLKDLLEAQ